MAVIKIVPMPGAVGDKGDPGETGSQGPQGQTGQTGQNGQDALWSYQGAWQSNAAYAVGDLVTYQGQLYYTKSVTTAGTLPTNVTKFDLIASKGADGEPGINGLEGETGPQGPAGADGADGAGFGIFYLGNYNPSSGYVPDIAVVRGSDGQLYLAKASGQLGDPVGNTAQWEVWIPKGADGTNGTNGTNGADALWNFVGAYDGGTSYAIGDVATYGGQLWYRTHANGGTVGNTPSEGFIWALLAAKGADGSGGTADTGDITFDGVQIIGAGTASGDGYDLGTIELVPDGNITSDQYVIIDPTSPNHIHLRAGGVQDNSSAHIFLGGERNNIEVSDPYRTVKVNTKPDGAETSYANLNETSNTEFVHVSNADIQSGDTVRFYLGGPTYVVDNVTQEYPSAGFITVTAPGLSFITGEAYVFTRDQGYNNQWTFENNGVLSGPAMGAVRVNSLLGNSEDTLVIANSTKLVLDGGFGEFLNDESANNQIATIGDLPTGATGTFETSDSKIVTVTNGIITSIESLT